jgi:hypothetical protein
MKKTFITLLNEFIETNNKKVLEQPQRFMSLFLDYTQNEYRAETQVFSKFIASKQAQELKNNNIDAVFIKTVAERFQKDTLFEMGICKMVVFAYARFMGLIDQRTLEAELSVKKGINIDTQGQSDTDNNIDKKNNIVFCTKCGNQLKNNSKFCSQCGTPFNQQPSYGDPVSLGQQNQQTQRSGAIVHFYRSKSIVGAVLSPKLYMDGIHISNIKRNWKKTINIPAGMHIFTTKTEVTTEIRLQAEQGKEYYIRCGIGIGFFVGHFKFTLVDAQLARQEMIGLQAEE